MQLGVVVLQAGQSALAHPLRERLVRQLARIGAVAGDAQAPQRAVQRDVQRQRMHLLEDAAQVGRVFLHCGRLEHRRAQMHRHDAAGVQHALAQAEEFLRIQVKRRRVGVGQVEHDQIEFLAAVLHELEAVAELDLKPRVVERALVDLAQPVAADVDHHRVQFGHHDALDARVLEDLFRRAAVAAADHQHALRVRMREQRRMRHALVIEELLAFGGHQPAVEPEQFAELVRVVDLDALVRRLHRRQLRFRRVAVAGVRIEPVEDQFVLLLAGLRHAFGARRVGARGGRSVDGSGGQIAAADAVDHLLPRAERHHQRVEQLLRLARIVVGEVAHVDVERDAAPLGPGVDRQVRLGQQHGAGDAAGLALPVGKHVVFLIDDGEPRVNGRGATERRERVEISEKAGAASAVEQIASQVKSLHLRPPAGPPNRPESRL